MQALTPLPTLAGCALWLVALDDAVAPAARSVLSEDEWARARRFIFARDRQRFIAAHAALREVLARHLSCTPAELRFEAGAQGKPRLADAPACAFNLSHSGAFALIAVNTAAGSTAVGVDLEIQRPMPDALVLAQTYFDAAERDALAALPEPARAEAFLRAWTRKEACLKARGSGLAGPDPLPATGIDAGTRTVAWPAANAAARLHSFDLPQAGALASLAVLHTAAAEQAGAPLIENFTA